MTNELPQPFADLVGFPAERRNLEFKRDLAWLDGDFRWKFAKAAMAMSNLPDGGFVIIGVAEDAPGVFSHPGLSDANARSFSPDVMSEFVNGYADPPVVMDIIKGRVNGALFVVAQIEPFTLGPTLCKKTGGDQLRVGDVYVRSRRRRETARLASATELRELIDRAVMLEIQRIQRIAPHALEPAANNNAEGFDDEALDREADEW